MIYDKLSLRKLPAMEAVFVDGQVKIMTKKVMQI